MTQVTKSALNYLADIRTNLETLTSALSAIHSARAEASGAAERIRDYLRHTELQVKAIPDFQQANVVEANKPALDKLLTMFSGEFKLRTEQALVDGTALSVDEIYRLLDDSNTPYYTRVRRGDGATMLGLA